MNRSFCTLLASLVTLSLASGAAAEAPETDDQKMFYVLGTMAGQNLAGLGLTEEELVWVQEGIGDVVQGETVEIDLQQYGPKLQALLQQRQQAAMTAEKAASAAFLAEQAAKPGVTKLASGVLIEEVSAGSGKSPVESDTVKVHYHGTLADGTKFDSSVDRGEPAVFPLTRVIPCWTEGLQKMKTGGKARLVCPSDVAYGDSGRPPSIPGGAALVFEVELIEIVDP